MNTIRERRSSDCHAGQPRRRVEDVLDAVDRDRAILAGDVEDALDAQQILAAVARQRAEPEAERLPVDRLVDGQAGRGDPLVVAVDVVRSWPSLAPCASS
jgi:hypothetical protein